MKAIRAAAFGDPSVLKLVENHPVPVPSSSDVIIRVKAVGVNPVETYIRAGAFSRLPSLPYTPGYDCAGVVETVGDDVKAVKPGDRVWTFQNMSGTYAECVQAKEDQLAPLPDELSFEQGAALGIPYMTAYRGLVQKAGAKKGETVLVHGASGGTGVAGVQLAKGLGCTVIGTAGTPEGVEVVEKAGADKAFNHRDANYLQEMLEFTSGIDVILEMAADINLGKDLTLLSPGGRVVIVGSRGNAEVNPRDIMAREASVTAVFLFKATPEEYSVGGKFINNGAVEGWVRPIVGKRFPLANANEAHRDIIESKGALGRTILTLD